jgi:hypothetical protein
VLCPVRDPELRQHLRTVVLDSLLRDTERAYLLQSDGTYVPAATAAAPGAVSVNSQQLLLESYTRSPALAE